MDLSVLATAPAFATLTDDERERIASLGTELEVGGGQVIIEQGSRARCFFVVLSGGADVYQGDTRVATLEPGAIVGEMSLFNDNKRTSAVISNGYTTLLRINTGDFWPLVLHNEPAAVHFLESLGKIMTERLQAQDAEIMKRVAENDSGLAGISMGFEPMKRRLMGDWSLKYHSIGRPGKLAIMSTKPTVSAADLSVAYSPGVAEPCIAIQRKPDRAYDFTARGQLVGVVTNGTAVLGLGDIGPLAAKPVMEGKAVLFKKFADIDAFDIEVEADDPDKFVDVVCAIAPTFGGINLEDIKAPECFRIEKACQERLDIPVFHDDQHGTAIVSGAALLNAVELVGKRIEDVRVVFSGAGAAGTACALHFIALGVRRENVIMTDVDGVVYVGRGDEGHLKDLAAKTGARTLADVISGADVFVGASVAGVLKPSMLARMEKDPLVFALANPDPEIDVRLARKTRPDVVIGTGRSDYPNQINNVIAFPYVFRGALDTRSRAINEAMKHAASHAIAALAREPIDAKAGFDPAGREFGRDYLIPMPFDRRLLLRVACAVAVAAVETGAARREMEIDEYAGRLERLSAVCG